MSTKNSPFPFQLLPFRPIGNWRKSWSKKPYTNDLEMLFNRKIGNPFQVLVRSQRESIRKSPSNLPPHLYSAINWGLSGIEEPFDVNYIPNFEIIVFDPDKWKPWSKSPLHSIFGQLSAEFGFDTLVLRLYEVKSKLTMQLSRSNSITNPSRLHRILPFVHPFTLPLLTFWQIENLKILDDPKGWNQGFGKHFWTWKSGTHLKF